jgi:hypothetical protein
MAGGAPEKFQGMGPPWWSPNIPHTTSYAARNINHPIVDGRMYIRGGDGIYCYDLRKKQ